MGRRDVFGDAAVVGDRRWGGSWGIDAELWARSKVFSEEKGEKWVAVAWDSVIAHTLTSFITIHCSSVCDWNIGRMMVEGGQTGGRAGWGGGSGGVGYILDDQWLRSGLQSAIETAMKAGRMQNGGKNGVEARQSAPPPTHPHSSSHSTSLPSFLSLLTFWHLHRSAPWSSEFRLSW